MDIGQHIAQGLARLGRWLLETNDNRRLRRQHNDADDLTIQADIPYLPDDTQAHLLDIYRPKDGGDDLPVIVNIHGGGLIASYKTVNTYFNHACARMGYAVVSLSYQRVPDTTLIHQIKDVMDALRFIRTHSEHYRLNMNRCYLTGDSAGALLGLYALSIERSQALQQVFGLAPAGLTFRAAAFISIMLDAHCRGWMAFIGKAAVAPEEKRAPYMPYILDPGMMISQTHLPPLYLVTSAEDFIRRDTLRLDHLLTTAGIEHRLHDRPRGEHYRLDHVFSVLYPLRPESRQVLAEIDAFFRQHQAEAC